MNSKPHLTYKAQVNLLISRGLEIQDESEALKFLEMIGYYKLSGYFYPFRKIKQAEVIVFETREDEFIENVSFNHIIQLYEFDKSLNNLLTRALADFEQALRAKSAYLVGQIDPYAHMRVHTLHPKVTNREYLNWLEMFKKDISKAKLQKFVTHHAEKYSGEMPIWVAVEVMQFGTMASLINLLDDSLLNDLSRSFGFENRRVFKTSIEAFRRLRNDCVHHNRVWNASHHPKISFKTKFFENAQELHHLTRTPYDKIYGRLVLLLFTLKKITNSDSWTREAYALINNFPAVPILTPEADMGFPDDWQEQSFWNS